MIICNKKYILFRTIYSGLVQKSSDSTHPLTFLTQTISFYTTTNKLKNPNDESTCTIAPRFVDKVYDITS